MEFRVRSKQRLAAAHADVGSFRLRVLIFSGEGRLRSLLPRHVKLVWIQLGLPLRFALFYFFGHVPRLHQRESSGAGCHAVIDRPQRRSAWSSPAPNRQLYWMCWREMLREAI